MCRVLYSVYGSWIQNEIKKYNVGFLENHFANYNKTDRNFQLWEREPMIKECWTKNFFRKKLNYTNLIPASNIGNLTIVPENYKYSSACFYKTGIKNFDFLTHFNDLSGLVYRIINYISRWSKFCSIDFFITPYCKSIC